MITALLLLLLVPGTAPADDALRAANARARAGDYPRAIAGYAQLAGQGHESASLYWNWAQAASARGAHGEALWALLRARELDPADRALAREIERARAAANLDAAEIAPEPLSGVARVGRFLHLDLLALALGALSLLAHLAARLRPASRAPARVAWTLLALALLLGIAPAAGALARPTAVVVGRGAALVDAASPSGAPIGTLREGEVVPVLAETTGWLRVEDSSGARGWAQASDLRRLDRPAQ